MKEKQVALKGLVEVLAIDIMSKVGEVVEKNLDSYFDGDTLSFTISCEEVESERPLSFYTFSEFWETGRRTLHTKLEEEAVKRLRAHNVGVSVELVESGFVVNFSLMEE